MKLERQARGLCREISGPTIETVHACTHAQVKAVAAAAEAALKAFVALLNPQGISIILPDLLAALDTKKVRQQESGPYLWLQQGSHARCPQLLHEA